MFEKSLNNYDFTEPIETNETSTYTKVYFELKDDVTITQKDLINFLKEEFAIFLKVNSSEIFINNDKILYNDMIVLEKR